MLIYKSSLNQTHLFSPDVKRPFGENWFIPRIGLVMIHPMPDNATEQVNTRELLPLRLNNHRKPAKSRAIVVTKAIT